MPYAYGGTILRVDLSEGRITREPTSSYSGAFLGGRGINMKLLYDGSRLEDDPLDPSSLLIFGVGPLSGTPAPTGRLEVTARSPRGIGYLGASNIGGQFGHEMKRAGYDNIVVTGKADRPVYLLINNDDVEIRDASGLWGKDTYETQEVIRRQVDVDAKVMCIGPAGENLVLFATIQHGVGDGAGRTGMGAVMGSKKLKAIVVRGTKGVTLAQPDKFLEIAGRLQSDFLRHPGVQMTQRHGLSVLQSSMNQDPNNPQPPKPHDSVQRYSPKRLGCAGCPVRCKDLYPAEVKGGGAVYCEFVGEAYETVGNSDPDLGLETGFAAQRYGIDIVTAMMLVGWLMDLQERGIVSPAVTDGVSMEWGSREAILGMLKKMVYREGFGDVLANGMSYAMDALGGEAKGLARIVRELPTNYLDYVLKPAAALGLAVGIRGDLMKSTTSALDRTFDVIPYLYDKETVEKLGAEYRQLIKSITPLEGADDTSRYEGKPELVVYGENMIALCDSMSTCKFLGAGYFGIRAFTPEYQAQLFSAASGIETSVDDLFQYAGKIRNLERVFEVMLGVTRETDVLPGRYVDRPLEFGSHSSLIAPGAAGMMESRRLEEMKSRYYGIRGWDLATGIPTAETLERCGLEDAARDLEASGKLKKMEPAQVLAQ